MKYDAAEFRKIADSAALVSTLQPWDMEKYLALLADRLHCAVDEAERLRSEYGYSIDRSRPFREYAQEEMGR